MSVRLIVDSTADMSADIRKRAEVVPLTILFGTDEYIDGVTIDHTTFYKMLDQGNVLPTTSQATPEAFRSKFEEVKAAGDEAVVITIASQLSGTCQSALIAAQDYDNIYVVDSQTVTIGTGILIKYALSLIDRGMAAKEVAAMTALARERIELVAMVDTLEYLKRGGRISRTAAFAGGLLNLKPILNIKDGVIGVLSKARGLKQGFAQLHTEIQHLGGIDLTKPVLMGYTGLEDTNLIKFISESAKEWGCKESDLPCTVIGSVVGTHAGPGAVAAAFFRK